MYVLFTTWKKKIGKEALDKKQKINKNTRVSVRTYFWNIKDNKVSGIEASISWSIACEKAHIRSIGCVFPGKHSEGTVGSTERARYEPQRVNASNSHPIVLQISEIESNEKR